MKRWLILAALVIGLTATATVAVQYLPDVSGSDDRPPFPGATSSKPTGPQPVAVVDEPLTFEFGAMAQHSEIQHEWTIRNSGVADLVITKGPPACSCTIADFSSDKTKDEMTLKPGGDTKLHLTFQTRDNSGQYRKSATVTTNDLLHPRFEFAAHGEVQPPLILVPPDTTIFFSSISNDTEHPGKVALFSKDQPDFKVLKVTSSKPDVIVVGSEPLTKEECVGLKTDKGYRITLNIKPGLPLGGFREEVVIETDHPKQHELRLTLGGKVVGPVSAIPDHVDLKDVHSKKGGQAEVLLVVRGLRETKFVLQDKPEKLEVAIAKDSNQAGRYRMTVTVPPGTPTGLIEGEIVLTTDHPDAETVKIPVEGFVSNPN